VPPLSAVVLLTAAATAAVLATLVHYITIAKVNEKLPPPQQIPYLFTVSYPYVRKPTIVRTEYKRLYPHGRLPLLRIGLELAAFALAVAAAEQFSQWWH
jgi:hypothetical protein